MPQIPPVFLPREFRAQRIRRAVALSADGDFVHPAGQEVRFRQNLGVNERPVRLDGNPREDFAPKELERAVGIE